MGKKAWFGLVVGLVLMVTASIAGAGDTSPYLIGAWEDDGETIYTDFIIVNPTVVKLDVYAAFFDNDGVFIPGRCFKRSLNPNAKWYLRGVGLKLSEFDSVGTAKFIAFPAGKKTVDFYAVIGGFQNRWVYEMTSSQAGLNGVPFPNVYTMGEVTKILSLTCTNWEEPKGN
jgi:hypothetical protein